MNRLWEIKQANQPDTLDMYIYGYIEGDGWWNESETSAKHFQQELAKYPDAKFINLYVNSNGGDVMEAMGIRNQLKRHPAYVTGYVDGFACSAGSFVLTGCDKVIMYSNTMQMLHNMRTLAIGNYKELKKAADDLEQISIGNRKAYLEKARGNLTEEQLIDILDNETWLTAEQCVEYGLADEIIAEEKDLTEAKEIAQRINKTVEQQISYNKALVAQIRELATPAQKQEPEPDFMTKQMNLPKENKIENMMAALFR